MSNKVSLGFFFLTANCRTAKNPRTVTVHHLESASCQFDLNQQMGDGMMYEIKLVGFMKQQRLI